MMSFIYHYIKTVIIIILCIISAVGVVYGITELSEYMIDTFGILISLSSLVIFIGLMLAIPMAIDSMEKEPIKMDTADDILRDIVNGDIGVGLKVELIARAKFVLGEK